MSDRLIQILSFSNVAAGDSAFLPNLLNVHGVPVIPDLVLRDNADFTVLSVTDSLVTVQNTGSVAASLNLWLQFNYSAQRALGEPVTSITAGLTPRPFQPAAGGTADPWGKRTQIALTYLAAQWQASANLNLVGSGDAGAAMLGNVLTDGTKNNVHADVNLGDANTFGAVCCPVIYTGIASCTITGFVSTDHDTALGFQTGFYFNDGYGNGAVIVQNGMRQDGGLTLANESASSSANNRMTLPGGVNLVVPFGASALLLYKLTTNRWELQG